MPEIKHNFTGGKMNKDLDERLVSDGEYRDAMNIQVATSEDSDVATAQNILGNQMIPVQWKSPGVAGMQTFTLPSSASVVGMVADEKTDKLYYLVYSADTDYILSITKGATSAEFVFIDQKTRTDAFGNLIPPVLDLPQGGFHITGITNQEIKRTVTKSITGKERNQHLYEYALGTPYDASTISFTNATTLVRGNAEDANQYGLSTIEGFCFNNNGTKAYAVDSFHARVIQYTLTSAYDVTTLLYSKELDISARGLTPVAITFNNDGTKMYIIENGGKADASPVITGGKINEYAVSSAYDIATATYTDSLDVSAQDANMKDLYFNDVARGAVNMFGNTFLPRLLTGGKGFNVQAPEFGFGDIPSGANQFLTGQFAQYANPINLSAGIGAFKEPRSAGAAKVLQNPAFTGNRPGGGRGPDPGTDPAPTDPDTTPAPVFAYQPYALPVAYD